MRYDSRPGVLDTSDYQDFRKGRSPEPRRGLTLSERYDRNRTSEISASALPASEDGGWPRHPDVTRPPIIQQSCALAAFSVAAHDVGNKQEEPPEIPGSPCSISLHQQALDTFKPKACVARAVVVFDPRHVPVPEISVCHGALLRVTRATRRRAFPIRLAIQRSVRLITHLTNLSKHGPAYSQPTVYKRIAR